MSERKSYRGGEKISRLHHGKGPMKRILFLILLAGLTAPGALFAADILGEVKALPVVKNLFPPQVEITEARDIGSLYELVVKEPPRGNNIYYVTKDGSYLIAGGNLIDKDKMNLTQTRHDEVNRVDLSKLPLKDAVTIKKGRQKTDHVLRCGLSILQEGLRLAQEPDRLYLIHIFLSSGHASKISREVSEDSLREKLRSCNRTCSVGSGVRCSKMRIRRKNARQAQSHWRGNWGECHTSFPNGYRHQNTGPSGPCLGELFKKVNSELRAEKKKTALLHQSSDSPVSAV